MIGIFKARSKSETRSNQRFHSRNSSLNDEMVTSSWNRASLRSKNIILDENSFDVLQYGVTPLIHESHHQFRTRQKTKEIFHRDFKVRNFIPTKLRAELVHKDFISSHLDPGDFSPQKSFCERVRMKEKELGPSIRHSIRTENERIQNLLNQSSQLDYSPKDISMLISPQWKENNRKKWISNKNFDLSVSNSNYQGKKYQEPWSIIESRANSEEKYIDGLEIIGDISRKRDKKLEISINNFSSVVVSTTNLPPINSTSIRSYKNEKHFNPILFQNKKVYPKTMKHILKNLIEDKKKSINSVSGGVDTRMKTNSLQEPKTSIIKRMHQESTLITPVKTEDTAILSVTNKNQIKTNQYLDRTDYIRKRVQSYFNDNENE